MKGEPVAPADLRDIACENGKLSGRPKRTERAREGNEERSKMIYKRDERLQLDRSAVFVTGKR
jgi:hypothetical protein